MTQYLISFDDGAMTFPEEEMPDVAKAAREVVQEASDAGVWVFSGGLKSQRAGVVATDGTVTDGPYPETKEVLGGFAVVDVPSREEALAWAAKIAVACRCGQEVRKDPPRPEQRLPLGAVVRVGPRDADGPPPTHTPKTGGQVLARADTRVSGRAPLGPAQNCVVARANSGPPQEFGQLVGGPAPSAGR
jgi:hypothetical protein